MSQSTIAITLFGAVVYVYLCSISLAFGLEIENQRKVLIPPKTGMEEELQEWQNFLLSQRNPDQRVTFKYLYVTRSGISTSPAAGSVRVRATDRVTDEGHGKAAAKVHEMLRLSQDYLWSGLRYSDLGIFAYNDSGWGTVFPEFSMYADRPECKNRCENECRVTCTFDGRKWSSIAGMATARLAVVLEDNVICTSRDPYRNKFSVTVHEYAHSVKMGAYPPFSIIGNRIDFSYAQARASATWNLQSYAMANADEYWAEGTTAYFNVNRGGAAGGLTTCTGATGTCSTESAAREHLRQKDPSLYGILSDVYTPGQPWSLSGMSVC